REWHRLLPAAGHTVRLREKEGLNISDYTVTLFHQLKCLEIYRKEYLSSRLSPSPMVHHCLNYLRQQILCHMNLRLESVKSYAGNSGRQYEFVCRDWSQIYVAAEDNKILTAVGGRT
ncbi:hypothetical protein C8J56DRAFT_792809, partial [Mycena floridula]